jgi:ribosome-interacting GTPase 1
MPANLTPQYLEADRKFKEAKTPQEKLEALDEMMATIPKHKGTEKMRAMIKTRIAKIKAGLLSRPAVAHHGPSFHVEKSGAGQVAVIGPPNSGKSSLIAALTGAQPEVGDYPYTTRVPAPYMMKFENILIQLVDTPPLAPEDVESDVVEVIKAADAVLFVVDLADQDSADAVEKLVANLKERRVEFVTPDHPAERTQFVKRAIAPANKYDAPEAKDNYLFLKEYFGDRLALRPVSAKQGDGIEDLRRSIFLFLDIIRTYSKVPGKKPEFNDPFALKKGTTVGEMARAVHKDFVEKFKYARVWRKDSLYQGQSVNRDFVLEDGDVVELHI